MTDPFTYNTVKNRIKSHRIVCSIYQSLAEMRADHDYIEEKSKANPQYISLLIQLKNDLAVCSQMLSHTIEMN